MDEIPAKMILNWDQTAMKIVPSSMWTMEQKGSKQVDVAGANDKHAKTAVFCGLLIDDFLPIQVIYKGKTPLCHQHYKFPSDWDITHSPRHWSNESTMLDYINNIIIILPYVEHARDDYSKDTPALVIMDNFKGQIKKAVTDLLETQYSHVFCQLIPLTSSSQWTCQSTSQLSLFSTIVLSNGTQTRSSSSSMERISKLQS